MDVYVQLPGKAGLGTAGSTSSFGTIASAAPSPAHLQRQGTATSNISNFSSATAGTPGGRPGGGGGGLSRSGSAASGVGTEGSASNSSSGGGGSGLLGVDLQQIVGAFSCETDRTPPNLDCGLAEWEHFYALHKQRVAASTSGGGGGWSDGGFLSEGGFAAGSLSRTGSQRPSPFQQGPGTPSSASSRNNYWTIANSDTGMYKHLLFFFI